MKPRPAQAARRPGPNRAGPFDSTRVASAPGTRNAPRGWIERPSGLVVPDAQSRRTPSAFRIAVRSIVLVLPFAKALSDLSHTVIDVVTMIHQLFTAR